MKIPDFFGRDNYLQNPIMRRFLKDHKIKFVENRADYIKTIEEFACQNDENEKEVKEWLLKVVKEGSKEICYRKIHGVSEWCRNPELAEAKIKEVYPDCPMENVLSYKNTDKKTMIEYHIFTNDAGLAVKIEFIFSKLFLYGNAGTLGDKTAFPVFIEVYLDEGFIISRAKAKSTLYEYDEENPYLSSDTNIDTMKYAVETIDDIIKLFGFESETDAKRVKSENSQMLYRIYDKYSFTPIDVEDRVKSQKDLIKAFVNQFFSELHLDVRNKEKAILDADILVEKFVSINGDNESIFKEDRPAYLIKVTADDELELTSIDTASNKKVPLQCTENFFDSKKSVVKSKRCNKLNLVFQRKDERYLSDNPLVVQFGTHKNFGYVKTIQYAEEDDIQNVLQAIFENY